MGLELTKPEEKGGFVEADQDYFLTADRKELVEETDINAAYLLARRGQMIPREDALLYGLLGYEDKADPDAKPLKTKKK